jgi:hypothetical protein
MAHRVQSLGYAIEMYVAPLHRWMRAAFFGLAALAAHDEALAYCRSTTCRPTEAKPCKIDDAGCPVDGAKLRWPTSCLTYAVNRVGSERLDLSATREAIRKSFFRWSDLPCGDGRTASLTFYEREPVSCRRSEFDADGPNLNVVLFQDTNWRYRGTDSTLAKTLVTFNNDTGEIYDADIEVNTAFNEVTLADGRDVEIDLQSVLTHEVGHFIGIAHSPRSEAVMYFEYAGGIRRDLGEDDVAAACAIYPPTPEQDCNPEPRGGFRPTCPATQEERTLACSVVGAATSVPAVFDAGLGWLAAVSTSAWLAALRGRKRPGLRGGGIA